VNVKSNFYSAFDGLQFVVFRSDGSKLAQQSYLYHQSPYTSAKEGALFPLNIERTANRYYSLYFSTVLHSQRVSTGQVCWSECYQGPKIASTLCSNIVTVFVGENVKDRTEIGNWQRSFCKWLFPNLPEVKRVTGNQKSLR